MYAAIIAVLIGIAAVLVIFGARRKSAVLVTLGCILGAGTLVLFSLLDFWGEWLWFRQLGYPARFWKVVLSKVFLGLGAAVLSGLAVFAASLGLGRGNGRIRVGAVLIALVVGGAWGTGNWDMLLRFIHRAATGVTDPILGRDAGFYLFTLPLLDSVYGLLLSLGVVAVGMYVVAIARHFVAVENQNIEVEPPQRLDAPLAQLGRLYPAIGAVLLILAAGRYLERFHLMYSTTGVVTGPGWTDVHIRLPAYLGVAVVMAVLGAALCVPALRRPFERLASRQGIGRFGRRAAPLPVAAAFLAAVWFLALGVVPGLFQWLRVEPNEITFERPFIAHNIKFTRLGFGLDDIEEREFPASEQFTRTMVEENQHIFNNVRLWDWRALRDVHKQFQEIRLYYEFADVDIDRYTVDGRYRQVMASARELELANLPGQSQTFVNRRFKYTHGYGITLTPVHEFTPEGLPDFLVRDIPPQARFASLEVERPEIYYGELTDSPVVVNSHEDEFDYPRGDENVYVHYAGEGGVPISGLWRKFLFGWMFDGTRFFLSSYPREESRLMFHRQIQERVERLAPFLRFDDDPYVVLADGKLYWIIDAYTLTSRYPYSERFAALAGAEHNPAGITGAPGEAVRLGSMNYVRNSVKAVVDAYSGEVHFYVFEPDDPLIKVWQRIFPGLFRPRSEMPEPLQAHVRYPADLLLIQGLVYAKFHMQDPDVFYNQEDLWVRATEKYHNRVQPVEPYYIMWEAPEMNTAEFSLILPFTPKNRQVLIGWIAGLCDGENYGRFLAYKFPKERRVLGPQQVETKIDQDSYLSGQLTLWDQRGSNVIRGNVLAIPIGKTLLYVEPIYLQAETAAYPELRLVAIMHNDRLSYAESFDEALEGLFAEEPPGKAAVAAPGAPGTMDELIQRADRAFQNYMGAMGEKRYDDAGKSLATLERALNQLVTRAKPAETPASDGGAPPPEQ